MTPNPSSHRVLILVATALTVEISACSSGSPHPSGTAVPSSATAAGTRPVSPGEAAGQQAIAAYLGMWEDVAAVATTSDWRSPRLAGHATGEALSVLSRQMYADHYNGLVSKGTPVNTPVVRSVEPRDTPETVLIHDCGDDSHWLKYRADTGALADNEPGRTRSITAEVKLAGDGSWRVTRFAAEGAGPCTP